MGSKKKKEGGEVCRWATRQEALQHFATFDGSTTSEKHIKPLHWYVASRLVVEGGFLPEEISPRPPFRVDQRNKKLLLHHDPHQANAVERRVLGGLKTKDVDVVVSKPDIGPVLTVSCKGMVGALRNITNRMEELVGDCTNLHIAYPAMVMGFLFIVRGYRKTDLGAPFRGTTGSKSEKRLVSVNDIGIKDDGTAAQSVQRLEYALAQINGRRGIRDEISRYEAIALSLVEPSGAAAGDIYRGYPRPDSPLLFDKFFPTLYQQYDERFVYAAPALRKVTQRKAWADDSPALKQWGSKPGYVYEPRLEVEEVEDEELEGSDDE